MSRDQTIAWETLDEAFNDVASQAAKHSNARREPGCIAMNYMTHAWLTRECERRTNVVLTEPLRFFGLLLVADDEYQRPVVVEVGAAKRRWPGLPWINPPETEVQP